MKIISLKNTQPGAIVARPIYDETMRLLANKGVVLSRTLITKLEERGHKYIYIQAEGTDEIIVEDTIPIEVSKRISNEVGETFKKIGSLSKKEKDSINESVDKLGIRGKFHNLSQNGSFRINVARFVQALQHLKRPVISSFALSMLGANPVSHAMDVSLLSIMLGQKLNYSQKESQMLAAASFMHDCGIQLMPDIVEKPYYLLNDDKELEMFKDHPRLGSNLLDYLNYFIPVEIQTILQHHENQDGSGFPSGFKGADLTNPSDKKMERARIFRMAEVLAVADRYVKYCAGEFSEIPKTPAQAINLLIKESGTILNSAVVNDFSKIINIFPKGAVVKVKDSDDSSIIGFEGVVSKENYKNMDKPVIVLLRSKNNEKIKPLVVDLFSDSKGKIDLLFLL